MRWLLGLAMLALAPAHVRGEETFHVFTTMCGFKDSILKYAKSMVLSLAQKTSVPVHLHIINDNNPDFVANLSTPLQKLVDSGLLGSRFQIDFPITGLRPRHRKVFRLCAMSRLLMAEEFPHVERGLYLDMDVLIMGDIRPLYNLLDAFNEDQWAGFALEYAGPIPRCAFKDAGCRGPEWRNTVYLNMRSTYLKHGLKYYMPAGLNTGVFLFDARKWRKTNFSAWALNRPSRGWKKNFPLGDQDLINQYFEDHRSEVMELPCVWNIRPNSRCAEYKRYLDRTTVPSKPLQGILHGNMNAMIQHMADFEPCSENLALSAWLHGIRGDPWPAKNRSRLCAD